MLRGHLRGMLAVVAVGSVTLSGCTAAEPEPIATPSPTPTTTSDSPTPTESSDPEDPYAIPEDPADIDLDYVQRVLEAIYAVTDEIVRLEVEAAANGATEPPDEAFDLLETIYDGEELLYATEDVANNWEDGQLVAPFADDPGPMIVQATGMVDVSRTCLIVTFITDHSARIGTEDARTELIALLTPKPEGADPDGRNPTPWVVNRQFTLESQTGEASC